ncbi:MAG: cation:proton antiporter [Lachnospiraceae bacterium]|jgi:Kef-type K+ transport system membrane component KefB
MAVNILLWVAVLVAAFLIGKLVQRLHLPAILGWLIAGMIFGPYGLGMLSDEMMNTTLYTAIIDWMQVAFGLMLGTELVFRKLRKTGRALVVTTLFQSLGTFFVVTVAFAVAFYFAGVPVYLSMVFGSIALATAPAPALSIVKEYHTHGPVTDTLLPMSVMDDVVGIVVFFLVNALITSKVSGGSFPLWLIPVMILLPIAIGLLPGYICGLVLKKQKTKAGTLATLLVGITASALLCWFVYRTFATSLSPNYMMVGVSFSAVFSQMITDEQLDQLNAWYNPILGVALLISIVNLGAPLDFHLILGAGAYTVLYIVSRAAGKYFGARIGAKRTNMPVTVQKYLGLTLLPHSGVSLVFTGIACETLASLPELAGIVKGTIAAAAVINEIIAVIAARQGFALAGEIGKDESAEAPQTAQHQAV